MIDNPQLLVDRFSCTLPSENKNDACSLDAIFIPFRGRYINANTLLEEIQSYDGPIYLMPSDQSDMNCIRCDTKSNCHDLRGDTGFIDLFADLSTSRHRHTQHINKIWDLPSKRNFALRFAREMGYKKILLLDDDIRNLSLDIMITGAHALDSYKIAGCFVEEFPDTSILGHLQLATGERLFTFLSGSFLFVRPLEVCSFFPCIYNEDWLFILPYIMENSVCSFGSIAQLPFDPFINPSKALFQEFGEIIAEGLYTLYHIKRYESRYESHVWEETIGERRQILIGLKGIMNREECEGIIDIALKANAVILPEDCITFIENWEDDLLLWKNLIKETENGALAKT